MNLNSIITTKVMVVTVFLFGLLNHVLPNILTREVLSSCIYWNDFHVDLCHPGTYKCNNGSDCCPCPTGTFMTWYNKCPQCLPFRDCYGEKVIFEGNFKFDRVCGDFPVSTESSVSPKLTEDAGYPPPSSEEDGQDGESADENKPSSTDDPDEPRSDEVDPSGEPPNDPEIGNSMIMFDWRTILMVVFLTSTLILTSVLVYQKTCSKQKCYKCQGAVGNDGDSGEILPLRKKHASGDDTSGRAAERGETSGLQANAAHHKKKNPARGRKRPGHNSS